MTRYCKCTNRTCAYPVCGKRLRVGGLEWVDEDTGEVHTSVHCEYGTGYTVGDVLLKSLCILDGKLQDAETKSEKGNKKSPVRQKKKLTAKGVDGALSQEDVARDFGVTRQTVHKWEENETENGPHNKSNKWGYYKALRLDPNLRGAYQELVNQVKMYRDAQAKAKQQGKRFRIAFERFNDKYAKHNQKRDI